ncbi:hypothetical protein J8I87_41460 [Paraburkholderia sp. LEh10]|jgi:hypothetical protein|uniref:hypothetical protein n=1 Tax=Paraburkholderia sp. LEh10 TaxID=2821353 RepID=UPI001AE90B50|nr:hypothetical protein [Paraburkholderia sp. LEh10]MBP0595973.1 hypothetical protein [Paraburkholderia sp. LEh10]MBP0595979.1 hypothetical protein [Paraburkholderia sp. LEh10]
MNIILVVNFFLSAKSNQAKEKIENRIKSHLDKNVMQLICCNVESGVELRGYCESWEQALYGFLKICQSMGQQWVLTGDIEFEFSAWTNHPTIVGVESIGVSAENPNFKKAE